MKKPTSDPKAQEIINVVDKMAKQMVDDQIRAFEPIRSTFYSENNLKIYQILTDWKFYKQNWTLCLPPTGIIYLAITQQLATLSPVFLVGFGCGCVISLIVTAIFYRKTLFLDRIFEDVNDLQPK